LVTLHKYIVKIYNFYEKKIYLCGIYYFDGLFYSKYFDGL